MSAHPRERKEVTVRARMKPSLKAKAEKYLSHYSLSHSQAINFFYQKVVEAHGLPFDLKVPSKETLESIHETEEMLKTSKFKSYKDVKKMFKDIEDKE